MVWCHSIWFGLAIVFDMVRCTALLAFKRQRGEAAPRAWHSDPPCRFLIALPRPSWRLSGEASGAVSAPRPRLAGTDSTWQVLTGPPLRVNFESAVRLLWCLQSTTQTKARQWCATRLWTPPKTHFVTWPFTVDPYFPACVCIYIYRERERNMYVCVYVCMYVCM